MNIDSKVSEHFSRLINTPNNFLAGKISQFEDKWKTLTKDKFILDIIKYGYKIEFTSHPCEDCNRAPIHFNKHEVNIISDLMDKFVKKGVITETVHEPGEIMSHIFIRPKPDGSFRLILNLSRLNEHVQKTSFKMETLKFALQLIRKDCFFSKIDLKDAFYSVPVNHSFRKYLKFEWQGKLYCFTCLPNGLSTASRIFTKVLKPVFSTLRKIGHTNVAYIDDSLLQSESYEACKRNIQDTMNLVDSVGLTIHPEKSIIIPTQCIEFVGFILNSRDMTVRLAPRKVHDIIRQAGLILNTNHIIIRDFAKLIGKMIAAEPGVMYAARYYKTLELEKDAALKLAKGNFDAYMSVSQESKHCIQWWIDNLESAYRPISLGPPVRRIETDSSLIGYGGHDVTNDSEFSGIWASHDKKQHINYLELKAAFLCLQYFCQNTENEHVHLYLDNTVAIKYISKMGGRKHQLNCLSKKIWTWCEARKIWLSVFHIPGRLNIRADKLSRLGKSLNPDMEWALEESIYSAITHKMGRCEIDLFASAKNRKHKLYVSYLPDKNAYAINAFSLQWNHKLLYAFPPFSVIGRVIQKVCEDKAELVLIAPIFPSQLWFPQLLKQVSGQCYVLPKTDRILYLPGLERKHRLTSMRMGAFRLSGNPLSVQDYQKTLPTSSCSLGEIQQQSSMGLISKGGCTFAVGHKLIQLIHL